MGTLLGFGLIDGLAASPPHVLLASRGCSCPTAPAPPHGYAADAIHGSPRRAASARATAWPPSSSPAPSPGSPRCRVSWLSTPRPASAQIPGTPAATGSPPPPVRYPH